MRLRLRSVAVAGNPSDEWLTGPQAAKRLGLELHTVHALIDSGELAAEVLPPGQRSTGRRRTIRIRRKAIDDFVERARIRPGELGHRVPSRLGRYRY